MAKKVSNKRIGVTRKSKRTGEKENFLDIYMAWPPKSKGHFDFNHGNDLAPFASQLEYQVTRDDTHKFELNHAAVYFERLASATSGVGTVYDNDGSYEVTWKVEQNYFKGS